VETGHPLSADQVAFYQRNGYIQVLDVLRKDELEDARAAVARVLEIHRSRT